MTEYPEYAKIGNKEYKINTDFRIAIECSRIIDDEKIHDLERSLAIIYLLFGEEGLKDSKNHNALLKIAEKFLSAGQELNINSNEKPDMDYIEDKELIKSSFKYDYTYNPYSMEYLHWYEFFNDLNNLSTSEFGNCCILNRIRDIRNIDLSKIKDPKELEKAKKLKERYDLKKYKKENNLTIEQEKSMEELNKILGL